MENYFKKYLKIGIVISSIILLNSCNKESVIEGAIEAKPTVVTLNKDITVNNAAPTNVVLKLNDVSVTLPFYFTLSTISATTSKYEFFCNSTTNYRWAVETYIKKMTAGEDINNNIFIVGGTPYFISALKTGSTYSYTYSYSFKVNELNYAAFRYATYDANYNPSYIFGWISFTATDSKITLNKYGYTVGSTLKVGAES